MTLLILPDLPTVWLGPWGTLVLIIITAVFAVLTGYFKFRETKVREKSKTWESAADAAKTEMEIHKIAVERLRGEKAEIGVANTELLVRIGKLEAATDLKPLIEAISNQQHMIGAWVEEGRSRFERAERGLDNNTAALKDIMLEIQAQRKTSEDSYRQLVNSFMEHTLKDEQAQLETRQVNLRFVSCLDAVERRLSEVAVRVGHVRWGDQPVEKGHSSPS